MSEKYKIRDQQKIYFVTFSVVQWIDVFTRSQYKDLLITSLEYCINKKGLEVYSWCIMSNHVHLIVGRCGQFKIEEIIRDFKKYTSVSLVKAIKENPSESRKEWLLWIFRKLAERSAKHLKYCFWQNEYHPIELSDSVMMRQKLDYIHDNPVEAGFVGEPEHWRYSSAVDYAGDKGLLCIKFIE
ncbi:REP-associated tyrosine transposase [Ekhidna sp.]